MGLWSDRLPSLIAPIGRHAGVARRRVSTPRAREHRTVVYRSRPDLTGGDLRKQHGVERHVSCRPRVVVVQEVADFGGVKSRGRQFLLARLESTCGLELR